MQPSQARVGGLSRLVDAGAREQGSTYPPAPLGATARPAAGSRRRQSGWAGARRIARRSRDAESRGQLGPVHRRREPPWVAREISKSLKVPARLRPQVRQYGGGSCGAALGYGHGSDDSRKPVTQSRMLQTGADGGTSTPVP
jgi:hypothetical protein